MTSAAQQSMLGLMPDQEFNEVLRPARCYHTLFATSPDGILTLDPAGCIQTINPGAERMFGCCAGGAVGR